MLFYLPKLKVTITRALYDYVITYVSTCNKLTIQGKLLDKWHIVIYFCFTLCARNFEKKTLKKAPSLSSHPRYLRNREKTEKPDMIMTFLSDSSQIA